MQFNTHQERLISINDGVHFCLAAAGSGKTEVLTERLSNALSGDFNPEDILCLTFTNRAALSMRERIESKLGDKAEAVFIGNTHSLALDILTKNRFYPVNKSLCTPDISEKLWALAEERAIVKLKKHLPFDVDGVDGTTIKCLDEYIRSIEPEEYRPLNEIICLSFESMLSSLGLAQENAIGQNDGLDFIYKIIPDLESSRNINHNKFDYRQVYSLIKPLIGIGLSETICEKNKKYFLDFIKGKINNYLTIEKLPQALSNGKVCIYVAILVSKEYDALKSDLLLYDFDDALCDCLKVSSRRYKWIQIDECQDLSPIQWLIVDYHKDMDAHILSFGDINQSIYRFLGASIEQTSSRLNENIHELPTNYRSPVNMVSMFSNYMGYHFEKRFTFKILADNPSRENALIWVERLDKEDQLTVLYGHAKRLAENNKKTAFLCATNKDVSDVSQFLSTQGLEHFRVSAFDILSKKNALDFISFLQALTSNSNTLPWSRLLWNLGNISPKKNDKGEPILPPQIHALELVSKLTTLKLKLSDFIGSDSLYSHGLKSLQRAGSTGFVYFDTETTGLNKYNDSIVQIAAVKVVPGKTDQELNLYCFADKKVGYSENIHGISDAFLAKEGEELSIQLKRFLNFCENMTIIAHNLDFDEGMLEQAIINTCPEMSDGFQKMEKLCSLELSKRLYPELKSHKLGFLLERFNLEGVNSHNAIDDVRAGVNLVNHMLIGLDSLCNKADELIDANEALLARFRKKMLILSKAFNEIKTSKSTINLATLIDTYFDAVSSFHVYNLDDLNELDELKSKLCRWSDSMFKSDELDRYLSKIVSMVNNIKESDLITDVDNMVVSTIHRAKGLEFDYVILPNIVERSIPAYPITLMKDSIEKDALLEEQKRLLYVAMTRAKQQLVIGTYTKGTNACEYITPFLKNMKKY